MGVEWVTHQDAILHARFGPAAVPKIRFRDGWDLTAPKSPGFTGGLPSSPRFAPGGFFSQSFHTSQLTKTEHSRMTDPPRQPTAGVGIEARFEHAVSTVKANDAVLLIFSLEFVDPMTACAFSVHRLQTIHDQPRFTRHHRGVQPAASNRNMAL